MKRVSKSGSFSIVAALFLLAIGGCATAPMDESNAAADGVKVQTEKNYEQSIEAYSAGDSEYTGFYNNFEFKATLLNTPVRELTLKRQGDYYQWDENKRASERAKFVQELTSETKVFVSFFTPDHKNDNLTDEKSIWRVFLDVGTTRYPGEVRHQRASLVELQALYPYHTRWNTPYMLHFKVPAKSIEGQQAKLTITGPLGTRAITFAAAK
jgi:hypothetical protein